VNLFFPFSLFVHVCERERQVVDNKCVLSSCLCDENDRNMILRAVHFFFLQACMAGV
jgi:hypothetical protein